MTIGFGDIEFTWITSHKRKVFTVHVHEGHWSKATDALMISALIAMEYNIVPLNFRESTDYREKFKSMNIGDPEDENLLDTEVATK